MKGKVLLVLLLITLVLAALSYLVAINLDLMPVQASQRAELVDSHFKQVLGISAFFFFVVEGALIYAVIRFRRKSGDDSDAAPVHGNALIETVWTVIPSILVVIIGISAYQALAAIERRPVDGPTIEVIARQFSWEFRYPQAGVSSPTLHLPVGKTTLLEITSEDVIHSLWIPEFRAKRDATPGQISRLLVTPTLTGSYPLICAELCGAGHASMVTEAVVHEAAGFEAWLAESAGKPPDPVDLYVQYGCNACHALADAGANGVLGPGLDGMGEVAASRVPGVGAREYILQSIIAPEAYLVEGFPSGVMPANFGEQIPAAQLEALVDYLLDQ